MIHESFSDQLDAITKNELIRSGFTRLDLSYFTSDEDVDYVLNAIEFIANDGWQFLPLYTHDSTTAVWRTRTIQLENPIIQLHSLQMITFENGTIEENFAVQQMEPTVMTNLNTHNLMINSTSNDSIEQARAIMKHITRYVCENIDLRTDPPLDIPVRYQDFIWWCGVWV
ncbi:unnamed protein product [Rotaria socialis]|uniref:Uncharacterized protein n=2 Tax=Rotaria socialis TaxID=392032 RepID=A0A818EDZ7_9BILA|nr:unnamed protein product [Rotaria socialis]